jgi:ATP-dependent Clp protease, protease subunit
MTMLFVNRGHRAEDDEAGTQSASSRQAKDLLFKARTVLVFGEINMALAEHVVGQLAALDSQNDQAIRMIINSPGGHVESGDSIHDMVRFVKSPVLMLGTGWVASAGAHIFLASARDHRFCLPNTRFMIHQPSGQMAGKAKDVEIEANEIIAMRARLNKVIADQTGQPLEKVAVDTQRNYWMMADAAVEYGLVGKIIESSTDFSH